MSKVFACAYEVNEGSDDPRAIQGGGGPSEKLLYRFHNSKYLIEAFERAYYNRYGDKLVVRYRP